MIKTINFNDFSDALDDDFSFRAKEVLWDFFESIEEPDNPLELDAVAIRCEYSEGNFEEVQHDYELLEVEEIQETTTQEDKFNLLVERLNNRTLVVYSDFEEDLIVYQSY
jgi:hypothetical protein